LLILETDEEKERRRIVTETPFSLVPLMIEVSEEFKKEFPDAAERKAFGKKAQEELRSGKYPFRTQLYLSLT